MPRLALLFGSAALCLIAGCTGSDDRSSEDTSDLTSEPDLFAAKETIAIELEGAFGVAFKAAHAGIPSGPLPGLPVRSFEEFPGKLTYTTVGTGGAPGGAKKTFDVLLKVRGNSSLVECPFPKLSVKFTPEAKLAAKNTMFAKNTKLKIGTHCADADDEQSGTVGRLRNEKSPLREVYAYQALAAVVPMSLSARASRITYVDTGDGTRTERNAMILEHVERLAKRSGAPDEHCRIVEGKEECDPVLTDPELEKADPREGMDRARIAELSLFHAAIGNWDWELDLGPGTSDGKRLWNTDVILVTSPDGGLTSVPVAQDFDLASATVGRFRGADREITPERLAKHAKENLARIAGLTPDEIAAAKATFLAKKEALYGAVDTAVVDEVGRGIARAHLDAFYAELAR